MLTACASSYTVTHMNSNDIKSYHRLVQEFVAALSDKMAKISTVQGLTFQIDERASYPTEKLRLKLVHAHFRKYQEVMNVDVWASQKRVNEPHYLLVEYRSARGHGYRDVAVTGTVDQQTNKLAKRALIRYSEAMEEREAITKENQDEKARADRWTADFTQDGNKLIPSEFARAWKTPGRYSINADASKVLQSDNWTREEVLRLAALLREIRASMVADGRLVNTPETEAKEVVAATVTCTKCGG